MHHGSLSVSQFRTRSPNRSARIAVYSAKRATTSRSGQPPASWSGCGRSQWNSVSQRIDPPLEQPVDEPVVEVEALRVRRAAAGGLDARPRDAEPIGPEAQRGHQVEVLVQSVEVVACDVAGAAVHGHARRVRVRVPDARAASVDVDGALDLVGGGGRTPGEARREPIDEPPRSDGRGGGHRATRTRSRRWRPAHASRAPHSR